MVYPLDEVLLLALIATLAGAEAFANIARCGWRRPETLSFSRLLKKPLQNLISMVFTVDSTCKVIFGCFRGFAKPLMRPWADSGQTHPVASRRGNRIKL